MRIVKIYITLVFKFEEKRSNKILSICSIYLIAKEIIISCQVVRFEKQINCCLELKRKLSLIDVQGQIQVINNSIDKVGKRIKYIYYGFKVL